MGASLGILCVTILIIMRQRENELPESLAINATAEKLYSLAKQRETTNPLNLIVIRLNKKLDIIAEIV